MLLPDQDGSSCWSLFHFVLLFLFLLDQLCYSTTLVCFRFFMFLVLCFTNWLNLKREFLCWLAWKVSVWWWVSVCLSGQIWLSVAKTLRLVYLRDTLRLCACKIVQSLHDENLHWPLHFHASFGDLDLIGYTYMSRSQGCQEGETEGFLFPCYKFLSDKVQTFVW